MQDMLLDIEMHELEPRIWRRFRVSGAISLNTLQDKVLPSDSGAVFRFTAADFLHHPSQISTTEHLTHLASNSPGQSLQAAVGCDGSI